MGLLGPFKGHEDAPWRGLSVCCAETRLGLGPDIAPRRLQPSLCPSRTATVRDGAATDPRPQGSVRKVDPLTKTSTDANSHCLSTGLNRRG